VYNLRSGAYENRYAKPDVKKIMSDDFKRSDYFALVLRVF
jgi:hypothetical protein